MRSSYEAEHYTNAIRDAMVYVTEVLRDKSGLDGDGRNLVGRALGFGKGQKPKIKVNKLETQTEQDIQNGLREVLSGMYALVRNPRTHERIEDDKKTADAIISFIDYLLKYLGESQPAFTVPAFVARVNDPYFVQNDDYVSELVASVPVRKRTDTMVALFREASWPYAQNFNMILQGLIREAKDAEVDHLLNVVSRTLEEATQSGEVSLARKLIPEEYWPRLGRLGRLRAENILIEELTEAWYDPETDDTNAPAATWLTGIIPYLSLKKNLGDVLLELLKDEHLGPQNYVARYFFEQLPQIYQDTWGIRQCTWAIERSITRGNEYVETRLQECTSAYPESWFKPLAQALESLTDPNAPKWYLPDGTPLLTGSATDEDDIPF